MRSDVFVLYFTCVPDAWSLRRPAAEDADRRADVARPAVLQRLPHIVLGVPHATQLRQKVSRAVLEQRANTCSTHYLPTPVALCAASGSTEKCFNGIDAQSGWPRLSVWSRRKSADRPLPAPGARLTLGRRRAMRTQPPPPAALRCARHPAARLSPPPGCFPPANANLSCSHKTVLRGGCAWPMSNCKRHPATHPMAALSSCGTPTAPPAAVAGGGAHCCFVLKISLAMRRRPCHARRPAAHPSPPPVLLNEMAKRRRSRLEA